MATATVPRTPSAPPQPRPMPTPAEVLAYCADHTNAEAAERWHISERYVRKLKARARTDDCTEDHPPPAVSSAPKETPPAPIFPDTVADERAADHTLWRDPWTGELLSPPPGVLRGAWEAERRAAQARHMASIMSPSPEQTAPEPGPAEQDRATFEASQTVGPARNSDTPAKPEGRNVPAELPPTNDLPVSQIPVHVVERRVIVRVPESRPAGGVMAWVMSHPAASKQMLGLVVLAVLIALTWVG